MKRRVFKAFVDKARVTGKKYPSLGPGLVIGGALAAPIGIALVNADRRKKRALKQLKSGKGGPDLRYELERARRRHKRR